MFQDMQIPVLPVGGGETQKLIAPIQDTLIANKAYSIGEEFIYSGVLFKVITAIPNGGDIILDGSSANVEVADTLVEQINSESFYTTKTIDANQSEGYKALASISLTEGIWLLSAWVVLPTDTKDYTIRLDYYEGTNSRYRIATAKAGSPYGVGITDIAHINRDQSNKGSVLYAATSPTYNGNFTGFYSAVKLRNW